MSTMRISRLAAGQTLIAEAVCLALWRIAGGKENERAGVPSTDDLRELVDGIGISGVTRADMSNALNKIRLSSWAEQTKEPVYSTGNGGQWRVTAMTRTRAKHAADALETVLMPPRTTAGIGSAAGPAAAHTDNLADKRDDVPAPGLVDLATPAMPLQPTADPSGLDAGASRLISDFMELLGYAEIGMQTDRQTRLMLGQLAVARANSLTQEDNAQPIREAARMLREIADAAGSDTPVGRVLRSLETDLPPMETAREISGRLLALVGVEKSPA